MTPTKDREKLAGKIQIYHCTFKRGISKLENNKATFIVLPHQKRLQHSLFNHILCLTAKAKVIPGGCVTFSFVPMNLQHTRVFADGS